MNLAEANLRGANLEGSQLTSARLERANLGDARLEDAHLWRASLAGAHLAHAFLKGADLREAILTGAHLGDAALWGTDMTRGLLAQADLTAADLIDVDLTDADLAGAVLASAHLVRTNLTGARLIGADLIGADLAGVDLSRAQLASAHFTGCSLAGVKFDDVDLSGVVGLEAARHRGPSTIGIDTVYRSGRTLPRAFLRGAGVPEDFIVFLSSRSRPQSTRQFYSCFMSYSRNDQAFAERLHADLQAKGVRCWFAPEDLKIGDRFRDEIEKSIRVNDKLVVILSAHSIASDWVRTEVETAIERERRDKKAVLFPIRLDDAVMTSLSAWAGDIRRTRHIGDFTKWSERDQYQSALARLLRDLEAKDAPPPAAH